MGIDQWEWEGMGILIVFPHTSTPLTDHYRSDGGPFRRRWQWWRWRVCGDRGWQEQDETTSHQCTDLDIAWRDRRTRTCCRSAEKDSDDSNARGSSPPSTKQSYMPMTLCSTTVLHSSTSTTARKQDLSAFGSNAVALSEKLRRWLRVGSHYAVQGHSRSLILITVESTYATSY